MVRNIYLTMVEAMGGVLINTKFEVGKSVNVFRPRTRSGGKINRALELLRRYRMIFIAVPAATGVEVLGVGINLSSDCLIVSLPESSFPSFLGTPPLLS